MVAQLRVDELALETQTATTEKREHYEMLINGSPEQLLLRQQEGVTRHFVSKMLVDFVRLSLPHWPRIRRLAASANDSEVLLWIELFEEDDLLENQLTDIEARVNSRFHELGYDLELMVVEADDQLTIPSHYAILHDVGESV